MLRKLNKRYFKYAQTIVMLALLINIKHNIYINDSNTTINATQ